MLCLSNRWGSLPGPGTLGPIKEAGEPQPLQGPRSSPLAVELSTKLLPGEAIRGPDGTHIPGAGETHFFVLVGMDWHNWGIKENVFLTIFCLNGKYFAVIRSPYTLYNRSSCRSDRGRKLGHHVGSQNAPSRVRVHPPHPHRTTTPPPYPQDTGSSLLPLSEGQVQETR